MSELDIRNNNSEPINKIRFNNDRGDNHHPIASVLYKRLEANGVNIIDIDYDDNNDSSNVGFVVIENEEQASNLIAALNKAIELGWLK